MGLRSGCVGRFLTSGTVEEDILQRAKQKMVLDHLVIQRMDTSGRTVLDASGTNTVKKMFGKDELQAILRFGAEELFKEDETKREERQNEMLSEDLESILARAEVVHDGEAPTDGSELLNSFNVATFRADEDDAAFWNRLIPVTERPKDEPANVPLQLGARSTRYRGGDDVRFPRLSQMSSSQEQLQDKLKLITVHAVRWSRRDARIWRGVGLRLRRRRRAAAGCTATRPQPRTWARRGCGPPSRGRPGSRRRMAAGMRHQRQPFRPGMFPKRFRTSCVHGLHHRG